MLKHKESLTLFFIILKNNLENDNMLRFYVDVITKRRLKWPELHNKLIILTSMIVIKLRYIKSGSTE